MTEKLAFPLTSTLVCEPGPDGHCAICSDEALPGQVLEIRPNQIALVQMETVQLEIALDLVENVQTGERLLIHAGVAIAKLED